MSKPKIKWRAVDAYKCVECGHLHEQDMWSSAPNPFDPKDTIIGCVSCYAANSLVVVCAAEGCSWTASGSSPDSDWVYRWTCRGHKP